MRRRFDGDLFAVAVIILLTLVYVIWWVTARAHAH